MTAGRAQPSPFDRRALGRAITRASRATFEEMLRAPAAAAVAPRIGITGAPGVGKSTLIARLVRQRVERSAPLAVIAVDPTSPHTSGSLLGDRIRMEELADDPRVYVRSLPSGQTHDGLGDNLPEVLAAIDEYGFAEVIIETVGVGQSEYGVRELVDVEVLVVMPGSGDTVQAMKAGILETADIVVVNKADLPGAQRTALELRSVFASRAKSVRPPIVLVHPNEQEGIEQLCGLLDDALATALRDDARAERERRFRRYRVQRIAARRLNETLAALPSERFDRRPADLYRELLARMTSESGV